jgi:hypothetical protein
VVHGGILLRRVRPRLRSSGSGFDLPQAAPAGWYGHIGSFLMTLLRPQPGGAGRAHGRRNYAICRCGIGQAKHNYAVRQIGPLGL